MSAVALRRPAVGAAGALALAVIALARIDPGSLTQWAERIQRLPKLVLTQPARESLALAGGALGKLEVSAEVVETRSLPTASPIISIVPWQGGLAVASFDDGAWLLDGDAVLPLEIGTAVNELAAAPEALYAATNDGAFAIGRDGKARQLAPGVFSAVAIWRGQPWFATTHGIATVDARGFVTYGAEHGLQPMRPSALADCGSALCIGAGDGLWLFDGKGARRESSGSGALPADEVTAVAFDGHARWAGTFDAGLARLVPKGARRMSPADGIEDGRIAPHALVTWRGLLLAGTPSGIEVVRGEAAGALRSPLPSKQVSALAADVNGIWMGYAGGIARLDVEAK